MRTFCTFVLLAALSACAPRRATTAPDAQHPPPEPLPFPGEQLLSPLPQQVPGSTKARLLPESCQHMLRVSRSAAGFQGKVVVRFIVRTNGAPDSFAYLQDPDVRSRPSSEVLEGIQAMLKTCRYEPAEDAAGRPIDSVILMPFKFAG